MEVRIKVVEVWERERRSRVRIEASAMSVTSSSSRNRTGVVTMLAATFEYRSAWVVDWEVGREWRDWWTEDMKSTKWRRVTRGWTRRSASIVFPLPGGEWKYKPRGEGGEDKEATGTAEFVAGRERRLPRLAEGEGESGERGKDWRESNIASSLVAASS